MLDKIECSISMGLYVLSQILDLFRVQMGQTIGYIQTPYKTQSVFDYQQRPRHNYD